MTPSTLEALAQVFDLTEADIEARADRLSRKVRQRIEVEKWGTTGDGDSKTEVHLTRFLRCLARQNHVDLPPKKSIEQTLNRLTDRRWWKGQLRKGFRAVEHLAIARGAVHCQSSAYVSRKALCRHERDRRRNTELLASLEVLNVNTGEVMPLDEIAEKSLANPANRRMALMSRIRGVELHSKAKGHDAMLVTITCPSRMHPRHFNTGAANEKFDGTNPRRAQAHLSGVWRAAMRQLAHQGIKPYGLRTVEPHHDACPHWHVLMFSAPEHTEAAAEQSLCRGNHTGHPRPVGPCGRHAQNRLADDAHRDFLHSAEAEEARRRYGFRPLDSIQ